MKTDWIEASRFDFSSISTSNFTDRTLLNVSRRSRLETKKKNARLRVKLGWTMCRQVFSYQYQEFLYFMGCFIFTFMSTPSLMVSALLDSVINFGRPQFAALRSGQYRFDVVLNLKVFLVRGEQACGNQDWGKTQMTLASRETPVDFSPVDFSQLKQFWQNWEVELSVQTFFCIFFSWSMFAGLCSSVRKKSVLKSRDGKACI